MNDEAEEIDALFGNEDKEIEDNTRIANLRCFVDSLPQISPFLDLIKDEIEAIRKTFLVYDIRLGMLAKDLSEIKERNTHLHSKISHEESLFKTLRELCLALSLDEEHIQTLESASFTDPDDMVSIEKALKTLDSINLEKFKIRAAQEKNREIVENERHFLKRFTTFLNKILVRTESTGELCVHRSLYDLMLRYKSIFEFSKKFHDYHLILCSTYTQHAKRLYEEEFQKHLTSIGSLATTSSKIMTCISVLLKSYESLVACECNFIKHIGMGHGDSDDNEIFMNISVLIHEFINDLSHKSRSTTILALHTYLSESPPPITSLKKFRKDTLKYCEMYESQLLKRETDGTVGVESIEFVNYLESRKESQRLKGKLLDLYIGKLTEQIESVDAAEAVKRYCLFASISSSGSKKKEADGAFKEVLSRKIIEHVFGNTDVCAAVKDLMRAVIPKISGGNEALRYLRQVVLEHADERERRQLEDIFRNSIVH